MILLRHLLFMQFSDHSLIGSVCDCLKLPDERVVSWAFSKKNTKSRVDRYTMLKNIKFVWIVL
ncbi:hypothetical protein DU002_04360 [Corallincola holothuriorum]|uniref:Uncharacterized protein n=1 Tax=Corallincola holothuriorum TaxID=2282215 RepID=A0A368NNN4_9GAMM|nr:hypothetical protein DU002_04360 [Corallincola holothuriorum]